MDATFRLRRSFRNQGLGFLPLFLAWFVLTLFAFGTDQKVPYRLAVTAGMASVPLFMAGLSVWMLAAYWREELKILGERVTFREIFGEKSFNLGEVIEARWRNWPGHEGGLVLRTESTRLAITLNNYEAEEQEQIVRYIRSVLSTEIQVGWNLFAYHAEKRAARAAQTKPGPDEILIRRDRWDRYLLPSLAVTGLAGVVAWWFTGNPGLLGAPLPLLAGWALMRYSTPAKGMIAPKLTASSNPETVQIIGFVLLWLLVAFVGLAVNKYFRPRMEQPDAILIVGAVVWFSVLIFEGLRDARRQSRREREAADLAAKARGEPSVDPWRAEDGSG